MRYVKVGDLYYRDGKPVTWQDIRTETGLERGHARLLLKKLAESGEDVEDILAWRDRKVIAWKLERLEAV